MTVQPEYDYIKQSPAFVPVVGSFVTWRVTTVGDKIKKWEAYRDDDGEHLGTISPYLNGRGLQYKPVVWDHVSRSWMYGDPMNSLDDAKTFVHRIAQVVERDTLYRPPYIIPAWAYFVCGMCVVLLFLTLFRVLHMGAL